ncbi:Na(+)-translocating NADH-quinone reductase subunit A [Desulfobacterales bacterium HSG2]|nr:Na(+)-translocating NADH-quinone reductase subunit A [Desulfobacterales bacterium HSG2]
MISIRIKKGYDLNIEGKPSLDLKELKKPSYVAALPEKIPFIKPRLLKEKGDRVKIGSAIFEDKRNPDIKFVSPGGGEIVQISFGPRRVIQEIVIQLDPIESYKEFDSVSEKGPERLERKELVKIILEGGLWPLIRAFPFRDIASPDEQPPAIFVSLDSGEPFQPAPEVYLKEEKDLFGYGIHVLRRLAQNVHVCASRNNLSVLNGFGEFVTHTYKGGYPAGDPGVLLYHTKKSPSENRSWYISGQDVLVLAQFLKSGVYPVDRTVVVAGTSAKERMHIHTRLGVPLRHLAQNENGNARYVVGGILRGYSASEETYMGFYETSLTLIPEGKEKEPFGFVRPGYDKPSYSRAFLSVFNPSALTMNCGLHGDERACVNCGTCAQVCPVDILPQFTFKSVLADEVEEALEHGLLDCAECGLCSYVCPSKIEICTILRDAKEAYYKEQA